MYRIRSMAAGIAVAVAATIFAAAPASAHDELLASSPNAGDALAAAPSTVSLDFSSDVLTMGAVIVIIDAEGTNWVTGEPVLDGRNVTAAVSADIPSGGYEVRWRVVSSDGHPIAGIIPFTVGDAAPLTRSTPGSAATDDPGQNTESQSTQEDDSLGRVVLIGAIGAIIALAVFALVLFLLRRRNSGAHRPTPTHPRAPEDL
jgi:methionine-rich copper-binding protein CopC